MFENHPNTVVKTFRSALVPLTASVPFAAYAIQRKTNADHDEDLDAPPYLRCRPPNISVLCEQTKFSKKEVQIMYRAFKQSCPNGIVMLEQFQEIYSQFFPQGNVRSYAEYVFRTFDKDDDGMINFEFVMGLSVISRGTVLEKLEWIFSLYDIKRKGAISYSELLMVVQSIYELLGKNTEPPIERALICKHVFSLFKKMDANADGLITREEFIHMCKNNDELCASLALFDTKL